MAVNPALREELAATLQLGIPHSQFLGGNGRWTDLDRAKTLAFRRWEQEKCAHCGTTPRQWADDPDAFTWQLERCEGCARLADGQEAVPEGGKGYMVALVPPRFARLEDV